MATLKKVSSRTPLLDAAMKVDPHKSGSGWNKDAARALAVEAANQTKADMKLMDYLNLVAKYKNVAGYKNVIVATSVKYGVLKSSNFTD